LLGSFIGEFISAQSGLGYRILSAGGVYDVSLVFASLICMVILAFIFNGIIWFIEKTWMSRYI
jgi:NitT/TauT family transport system permease protein